MRIGLMMHSKREDALGYAHAAIAYLTSRGCEVMLEDEAAAELMQIHDLPLFAGNEECLDVLLSLGGDGTLLRGAQYALRCGALLLGINLGRVGFLAEVEPEAMEEALDRLIRGDYTTETRPAIKVTANGETFYAINDVAVSRGGYARLITVEAVVDGESTGRYLADGLVVASPTGSTGYSLSAGGPVISPQVQCMVITPICAHSLQHRPAIVHMGAKIQLNLMPEDEQTAALLVDGQARTVLSSGMSVEITEAGESIRLIRIRPGRFFQLVKEKLTEWTR